MKKVLTISFIAIFTLLFGYSCWLGDAALTWALEMEDMTHFDLHNISSAPGEEALKFYSENGRCYEAVNLSEGITRDILTEGLSMKNYDEIVTTESGCEYFLYHDPLKTGEKYVLIVPTVGALNIPFHTMTRALGYYAMEVES